MGGFVAGRRRKARPRGLLLVAFVAPALAVAATGCDAIFGIEVLSGSDASVADAAVDASTMDAEASAATDAHVEADAHGTTDAPVGDSGSIDAQSDSGDAGPCADGGTRCGGGGVQTCDNGTWSTASPCTGSTAFCLNGACVADAPSCADGGAGQSSCGTASESCCTNEVVPGGTFDRSYDDVTYADAGSPATVSTFRLDKYEVTVGRYRAFVNAYVNGWRPTAGSGKHAHLNGGNGLIGVDSNPPPFGFEPGWASTDTPDLATTSSGWNTNLLCDAQHQEWTASPGANENLPIGCETWTEAYAFCVWDGGFLPSEAEWNYAAAGGGGSGGQRVYPWSVPSTDQTIDCTHANLTACVGSASGVGSLSPLGDGAYGHADMAGNVWEWSLDWYAMSYVVPCDDCAYVGSTGFRIIRGGAFDANAMAALASYRLSFPQLWRSATFGLRCARAP